MGHSFGGMHSMSMTMNEETHFHDNPSHSEQNGPYYNASQHDRVYMTPMVANSPAYVMHFSPGDHPHPAGAIYMTPMVQPTSDLTIDRDGTRITMPRIVGQDSNIYREHTRGYSNDPQYSPHGHNSTYMTPFPAEPNNSRGSTRVHRAPHTHATNSTATRSNDVGTELNLISPLLPKAFHTSPGDDKLLQANAAALRRKAGGQNNQNGGTFSGKKVYPPNGMGRTLGDNMNLIHRDVGNIKSIQVLSQRPQTVNRIIIPQESSQSSSTGKSVESNSVAEPATVLSDRISLRVRAVAEEVFGQRLAELNARIEKQERIVEAQSLEEPSNLRKQLAEVEKRMEKQEQKLKLHDDLFRLMKEQRINSQDSDDARYQLLWQRINKSDLFASDLQSTVFKLEKALQLRCDDIASKVSDLTSTIHGDVLSPFTSIKQEVKHLQNAVKGETVVRFSLSSRLEEIVDGMTNLNATLQKCQHELNGQQQLAEDLTVKVLSSKRDIDMLFGNVAEIARENAARLTAGLAKQDDQIVTFQDALRQQVTNDKNDNIAHIRNVNDSLKQEVVHLQEQHAHYQLRFHAVSVELVELKKRLVTSLRFITEHNSAMAQSRFVGEPYLGASIQNLSSSQQFLQAGSSDTRKHEAHQLGRSGGVSSEGATAQRRQSSQGMQHIKPSSSATLLKTPASRSFSSTPGQVAHSEYVYTDGQAGLTLSAFATSPSPTSSSVSPSSTTAAITFAAGKPFDGSSDQFGSSVRTLDRTIPPMPRPLFYVDTAKRIK